jgi:type II secretory pathway component PulK
MKRGQQGIALVLVLWGAVLLSLLAASLAQSSGLAGRQIGNLIAHAQLRSHIDDVLAIAVLGLIDPDPERHWRGDGGPHRLTLEDGTAAEIRVWSEAGHIDLNHAPAPLLQSLLRQAAGSQQAGDALLAQLARRTDPQTGRPLLAVGEMAGFPGVTPAIFARIAAAATVHNPSGALDWRSAPPAALQAVPGLSHEQVASLLARRGQSLYTPEAAIAEALQKIGAAAQDPAAPGAAILTLQLLLTKPGSARLTGEVLLQIGPNGSSPYRILEWRAPAMEPAA